MSADVVSLGGHEVGRPGETHPDVIRKIEDVLELARSGNIGGVLICTVEVSADGTERIGGAFSSETGNGQWALLTSVRRMTRAYEAWLFDA